MPTGAGFGVGAVVSILHKVLKPRNVAMNTFGNEYQLGRTADFVVRELLEEVAGQPPQARVSSPSYRVDDEPILFTVAWGCCKIVTPAPEGSRAQVQCPVCADIRLPHAFIDVLHRFEVARAQLLLCGIFQMLMMLLLMKSMGAMERVIWQTFRPLFLIQRTRNKMHTLILLLARHLRPNTVMMDAILARMDTAHMVCTTSHPN
jgi:hypothetical protein